MYLCVILQDDPWRELFKMAAPSGPAKLGYINNNAGSIFLYIIMVTAGTFNLPVLLYWLIMLARLLKNCNAFFLYWHCGIKSIKTLHVDFRKDDISSDHPGIRYFFTLLYNWNISWFLCCFICQVVCRINSHDKVWI